MLPCTGSVSHTGFVLLGTGSALSLALSDYSFVTSSWRSAAGGHPGPRGAAPLRVICLTICLLCGQSLSRPILCRWHLPLQLSKA